MISDIEWEKEENKNKASPNYSKEVNETIINLVNEHKGKLPNYIIENREKGIDNCCESLKDILISLMTQNIPQKKLH